MTDDQPTLARGRGAAEPTATESTSPSTPTRVTASGARPASRLEILGWIAVGLGVLVLAFFALTRSFA